MKQSIVTMRRIAPVSLLVSAMLLSACANTVRGVGKDLNATADAVEESVD